MNAKETPEIKDKSKLGNHVTEKELISVAKGMKKDGFSTEEIVKETGLPTQLIRSLQRK
jgi:hypothetical protein